ncbi:MAG: cation:proton antiporter [Flavobacteriales bacterium]|nr:cation:proton antiporter [Flavobacteriales bacterium]
MVNFGPYNYIIVASIVVMLSFVFGTIAKKTNVPAVLLLIALGVGFQYLLKYLGVAEINFFPILEVLGIVGLIMIVLEAALELELKPEKVGMIVKSLVVALIGLGLSVGSAGAILYYMVNGMGLLQALLYATPLSILSSAIIIPSVGSLVQHKKEFHIYESTFSDILGIMLFYFLIGMLDFAVPATTGGHNGGNPVVEFFISLGATLLVAFVASYILLIGFQHIKSGAKLFLLISMLLLLYAVGKKMHLSPLIIILVFGLIVRNSKLFFVGPLSRFLDTHKFHEMEHGLHVVTLETAFVVRTFFFVIFGISIALISLLSLDVLIISSTLMASIYAFRWLVLRVFMGHDIQPQLWIAPRGLITVLLFYAIPEEYTSSSFESGILLFIIIATGLVMTMGMIAAKKTKKTEVKTEDVVPLEIDSQPIPRLKKTI